MRAKRAKPRRAVHPVQPAHHMPVWGPAGSMTPIKVSAEYRGSVDLRQLAKGQRCYLPLDLPMCSPAETVVLAHLRRGHTAGMGQKPPDICAIPMCFTHHAIYDGRQKTIMPKSLVDLVAFTGLCQWLAYLWNNGYLHT